MEAVDNIIRGGTRIIPVILKAKRLMIPLSFLIASLLLYKLLLAPKIGEIKRTREEIARREAEISSLISRISEIPSPSDEEIRRWEEVERELARRLSHYDKLALLRSLIYLAYRAGADSILDVQAEDEPPEPGSPLNRYKLTILFHSNEYDPIVSFLKGIDELPPLVEVESVKLEGESPGISVEVTLSVYELGGERGAQE